MGANISSACPPFQPPPMAEKMASLKRKAEEALEGHENQLPPQMGTATAGITVGSACTGLGTCHAAWRVLQAWNRGIRVTHSFACDNKAASHLVLRANFPEVGRIFMDCLVGDFSAAPPVDVFTAAFPCQPFSSANRRRRGAADPRSQVLTAVLDYVVQKKPKMVLLENVAGLMCYPQVLEGIKQRLQNAGYRLAARILDSRTHGYVPQQRRRLYIVAALPEVAGGRDLNMVWPNMLPTPALTSILADDPCDPGARPSGRLARQRVQGLTDSLSAKGIDTRSLGDVVVNCNSISMNVTKGYTPCLTAARGAEGGFWLLAQCRMLGVAELMRLQGMNPEAMDLTMLPRRRAGEMLGQAFTQSMATRLLVGLLRLSGANDIVDPYARMACTGEV